MGACLLRLCAGACVLFYTFVDFLCELLRNVVGFRFRACCVVCVRVFCDKRVDACVGAFCL